MGRERNWSDTRIGDRQGNGKIMEGINRDKNRMVKGREGRGWVKEGSEVTKE